MTAFNTTGATPFHRVSTADNNATSLAAKPGRLKSLLGLNLNTTTPRYVKFYDKASAPAPATDTPVYVAPIPTVGTANGSEVSIPIPDEGIQFLVGIAFAIVGGIADTDNTSISASEVVISGSYMLG